MSAPGAASGWQVQGWCPGAHRPMRSGDGLVVRVRPWAGWITDVQARGLADLAQRYGSGAVEVTSRANLQLRGVQEADHPALIAQLGALSLLDADPASEGRRNIVTDPLSDDARQTALYDGLVAALRAPDFASLPNKFGFVLDLARPRRLAEISGDIRIEAHPEGLLVRAEGQDTGQIARDVPDALERSIALLRWFLDSGGVGLDGRGRLRRHLATTALPEALTGTATPADVAPAAQPGARGAGCLVGLPFGQVPAGALRFLADQSPRIGITPWRMLFVPGADPLTLRHPDLILAPDPLMRVRACTGAPGCAQASVATRDLARTLAPLIPEGQTLHLSGCAKGCAHPGAANVVLVGRDGAFDLVRHGAAWDEPQTRGLSPETVRDHLTPTLPDG